MNIQASFESNVILDRYKTDMDQIEFNKLFESNVILDRYKTDSLEELIEVSV